MSCLDHHVQEVKLLVSLSSPGWPHAYRLQVLLCARPANTRDYNKSKQVISYRGGPVGVSLLKAAQLVSRVCKRVRFAFFIMHGPCFTSLVDSEPEQATALMRWEASSYKKCTNMLCMWSVYTCLGVSPTASQKTVASNSLITTE